MHGPGVAKSGNDGTVSFGLIAITVLNNVLRPVLAKWHPLLQDYENARLAGVSATRTKMPGVSARILGPS